MTEPGSAGTTVVVSSVFGLESNSRSSHPLQGRYRISGGLFGEEPEEKSKDCADSMPCTSYAGVS